MQLRCTINAFEYLRRANKNFKVGNLLMIDSKSDSFNENTTKSMGWKYQKLSFHKNPLAVFCKIKFSLSCKKSSTPFQTKLRKNNCCDIFSFSKFIWTVLNRINWQIYRPAVAFHLSSLPTVLFFLKDPFYPTLNRFR